MNDEPLITHSSDAADVLRSELAAHREQLESAVRSEAVLSSSLLLIGLFWLGLALDWLLEPSVAVRKGLWLVVVGAAAGWLLLRLLPRLRRNFSDAELALALVRRRPELGDGFITAVEQFDQPPVEDAAQRNLLRLTTEQAATQIRSLPRFSLVNERSLVNWRRMSMALGLGTILLGALIPSILSVYVRRVALSPELWPRRVALSLVGFEQEPSGLWIKRVARDDRFRLVVLADRTAGHIAPNSVEMRTRTSSSRTRSENLTRVGSSVSPTAESLQFRHEFERVSESLDFTLLGGDARLGPCRLEASPRPALSEIVAEIRPASYLHSAPRTMSISAIGEIPAGSTVELSAQASAPLAETSVRLLSESGTETPRAGQLSADRTQLRIPLGVLRESTRVQIGITDQYDISSGEPYVLPLTVTPDTPPTISVALADIGLAITPEARAPLDLVAEDDHGLREVLISLRRGTEPPSKRSLVNDPNSELERWVKQGVIDLLTLRTRDERLRRPLEPGEKLTLQVEVRDGCDLPPLRAATTSAAIEFEIVSPEELVSRLGEREINLRQSFEKSIADLRRVAFGLSAVTPENAPSRLAQLGVDTQQVREDISSIAEAFALIAAELQNNRIGNTQLVDRVERGIAEPLRKEVTDAIAPLAADLLAAAKPAEDAAPPATINLAARATTTIARLERILARMRALETYNEIVTTLRGLIGEQRSLTGKTQELRREQARELLLE
jgi:hypothetical protein